jgi:hypothetical protein
MMTLPNVLSDWDKVEQEIRAKLDKEIHVKSQTLKETVARYKDLVEKSDIAQQLDRLNLNSS